MSQIEIAFSFIIARVRGSMKAPPPVASTWRLRSSRRAITRRSPRRNSDSPCLAKISSMLRPAAAAMASSASTKRKSSACGQAAPDRGLAGAHQADQRHGAVEREPAACRRSSAAASSARRYRCFPGAPRITSKGPDKVNADRARNSPHFAGNLPGSQRQGCDEAICSDAEDGAARSPAFRRRSWICCCGAGGCYPYRAVRVPHAPSRRASAGAARNAHRSAGRLQGMSSWLIA